MDYYYQPPKVELVQYIAINQKSTKYEKGMKKETRYASKIKNQKKSEEDIKREVRSAYGNAAKGKNKSKCSSNNCCGGSVNPDEYAKELGYTREELESVPQSCNMGLGCGNPQNIASLKEGEFVLDLGAGGGLDVFLAAKRVGPNGRVYGVDMTPEMISKARDNAAKSNYKNVEFLLGEIEHLPLPNNSVNVIISNCVVNLSTNKKRVFNEAFRVLKESGRIAISDMVALKPLPKQMTENKELYSNCISGAITINELKNILYKVGFEDIVIDQQKESRQFIKDWVPGSDSENYVVSAKIKAIKPKLKK
ncbi:MAG: Aklanonic acid methyltransferase DnrC [Candidatus Anoxychlamydiales bacterium]|uniref:Arsenite methyltransferase n=1 Tax=marine sediment metagenome TaxID=412755 RepID=A0A0F9H2K5_9ZZZZ|nr:Aklanonic acid methyltransferase DnrC [Candidatus Anoxychlamydiales bacterium]NGX41720.1 Aklanonic acid methyltransferase DnrC [Candidatus Anoxychlamydiales bacterium]